VGHDDLSLTNLGGSSLGGHLVEDGAGLGAALLLLLLGTTQGVLIIDQPEYDFDHRFIYNSVVQRLRSLKGHRQVIVATHNANVPVLGDAELVVGLEGDGQHGRPIIDGLGSLAAAIRHLVENILEGREAAFNAFQHLYGF
jgi:hypothetical protein